MSEVSHDAMHPYITRLPYTVQLMDRNNTRHVSDHAHWYRTIEMHRYMKLDTEPRLASRMVCTDEPAICPAEVDNPIFQSLGSA